MTRAETATAPRSVEAPVTVMQRVELKYMLKREQLSLLYTAMAGHMEADQFGLTTIASLYYDTPDRRLIRASLEKPAFKEKIRLRSYGRATESSPVFLELKRKALGTVYKRRLQTTLPEAACFFRGELPQIEDSQIGRELTAFRTHYQSLEPSCLIFYDRTAYVESEGSLRLTIDKNSRYRMDNLDLTRSNEGSALLPEGWAILELKVQDAMPLWLSHALSEAGIYKTSFSKYGEAYRREAQTPPLRSAC
ncbi:MAG: polyphosphate polymerase domain-containing protein [Oscillospiraceae bacterium]|nr:polyphosphate polymerase domain-containing protein [Oscillospiraceae bacterium]